MSRLAKRPIAIPARTEISISDGNILVKGPKGTLTKAGHRLITIEVRSRRRAGCRPSGDRSKAQALVGTYASHVRNMLEGVTKGFTKKLLDRRCRLQVGCAGQDTQFGAWFFAPG